MKEVHYSGGSSLLDDASADALLDYASALARADTSTTIELTTVETGREATTKFLVGPASDLVASPVTSYLPEPDNSEATQYMREETKRLNDGPAKRGEEHPTSRG